MGHNHALVVYIVGLVLRCSSVTSNSIIDVTSLISVLDSNHDDVISPQEVGQLFSSMSHGSSIMSRCQFTKEMTSRFNTSSRDVTALYDVIQNDVSPAESVSSEEFTAALMGGASGAGGVATATVVDSVDALTQRVASALSNPSSYTSTVNPMQYTDFKVVTWADHTDVNRDDVITQQEMTSSMLSLCIEDTRELPRCQFVEAMRSLYSQHPLTANRMYDVIFHTRDPHWADVDTAALLASLDENKNGVVTRLEFIDYFTKQNNLAAGVFQSSEGDLRGRGTSATLTFGAMMTSLVAVCLNNIL